MNIPEDFVEKCKTMMQYSLDYELFTNIAWDSLELVKFFLEDPRLPNHADVNSKDGRCLYVCKSKKMLKYLILEGGLRTTPQIAEDIKNKKVNFPNETRRLFKLAEYIDLHFDLQKEIKIKNKIKKKTIKI